jgi:hypothetical protein
MPAENFQARGGHQGRIPRRGTEIILQREQTLEKHARIIAPMRDGMNLVAKECRRFTSSRPNDMNGRDGSRTLSWYRAGRIVITSRAVIAKERRSDTIGTG